MQTNRRQIAIATLGCKVNQCDSAAIHECLKQSGYEMVPLSAKADIYIINTCGVTEKTEAQSRQLVRRALRAHPRSLVLVTGCYVQKSPTDLLAISNRVHVVGNREKNRMPLYVAKLFNDDRVINVVTDISDEKRFTTPACSRFISRTRAFLKIQDGCNSRCAYCIVPSVRGPSRSLPMEEVKSRFKRLVQSGYREVVLSGIHLGAYGLDLVPPTNLIELLESLEIDERLSNMRIRLSSIEPKEFTEELIGFISQSKTICPHLHIPLQSGDSVILNKMRRPYTPFFFKELIDRLTSDISEVNIGIDVIVGFPGETDGQFQNTVELIQSVSVGYLHVFPYSRRQGTAATQLTDHVSESVKKQRVHILRHLSTEKKQSLYASYQNKNLAVLVEGQQYKTTGRLKGFSRNYIPVLFHGSNELVGQEIMVKIEEVKEDRVFGTLAP